MRISSKSDYALRTVLYLALNKERGVVTISQIAHDQNIPTKFLEQILLALKLGGLVNSRRGAKGGYYLAGNSSDITVKKVLEVTEDAILLDKREVRIPEFSSDPFEGVWDELNEAVVRKLEETTLDEIVEKAKNLSAGRVSDYAI